MRRNSIWLFVNGIMCWPGSFRLWNAEAVTWFQLRGFQAESIRYLCGPIGRAFRQQSRIDVVTHFLEVYQGRQIHLVGHSNGCDLAVRSLAQSGVRVESLHLVAGACEADFAANGLNEALQSNRLGRCLVYRGGKDRALALAHTLPGRLLGYGTLGLSGPLQVDAGIRDRVGEIVWPAFGHSTCWLPEHSDTTFRHFLPAA